MSSDELRKLTPMQWGELTLPVTKIETTITPRLATNTFLAANSDELVSLGFASRSFSADLIFDASLKDAYPKTWSAFLKAVKEQEPKVLLHPIEGEITCFAQINYSVDSALRSGIACKATFTETLTEYPTQDSELLNSTVEPFLDKELSYAAELPDLQGDKPSLFDTLNALDRLGNQIQGFQSKTAKQLETSINKLQNTAKGAISALKGVGTAQSTLMAALLRKKLDPYLASKNKAPSKKVVVVANTMSVFDLAKRFGVDVSKLVELNPHLAGKVVVKAQTVVVVP